MNQINLKAESAKANNQLIQTVSGTTSLLIGAVIIVISLLAYGGVYMYHQKIKGEIDGIKQDLAAKQARLGSSDFSELYTFQERLTELKAKIDLRPDHSFVIDKIAKFTLPEIRYDKLTTKDAGDKVKVDLELIIPSYDLLGKQLKAFSLIEGVSEISPGTVTREGQIGSEITMNASFLVTKGSSRLIPDSQPLISQ